jgi:hypothetical protein
MPANEAPAATRAHQLAALLDTDTEAAADIPTLDPQAQSELAFHLAVDASARAAWTSGDAKVPARASARLRQQLRGAARPAAPVPTPVVATVSADDPAVRIVVELDIVVRVENEG